MFQSPYWNNLLVILRLVELCDSLCLWSVSILGMCWLCCEYRVLYILDWTDCYQK